MRRTVSIGLRVAGLALVVFILTTQVQYRDRLRRPGGAVLSGRIEIHGAGARFLPSSGPSVELGPGWRDHRDVSPGLLTIVRLSRKLLLLLFVFAYGPITLISISRWWYLLRTIGVPVRFGEAFRLTFIGFFFNSAVPGLTGGDLVKAVYIARRSKGARVKAFMSVLVDRLIGLFALGLLAALVLLPHLGDARFRTAATIVFLFLGTAVALAAVFLSRRLRRVLRVEKLLGKLPFAHLFLEVDRAVVIYRDHPRAVLLSVLMSLGNHLSLCVMAVGMGRALGLDVPAAEYFILVPVCMMLASIPLLPGGWGLRESAFIAFFGAVGVPATLAFALSVLIGLTQLAWSLLGGVFFLARPDRVTAREAESFTREVEERVAAVPPGSS